MPRFVRRPAEGGAGAAAAPQAEGNAAVEGKAHGPIYVSYREIKGGPPLSRGGKKPSYIKRFYLVDSHGNETLAATGEDQGGPMFWGQRNRELDRLHHHHELQRVDPGAWKTDVQGLSPW